MDYLALPSSQCVTSPELLDAVGSTIIDTIGVPELAPHKERDRVLWPGKGTCQVPSRPLALKEIFSMLFIFVHATRLQNFPMYEFKRMIFHEQIIPILHYCVLYNKDSQNI